MKILLVCSCFAPKNVIGAVRLTKIAKYFIRKDHEVTVISPELEKYDKIDNSLECEELEQAQRITIQYSAITRKLTALHSNQGKQASSSEVANQVNKSIKSRIYKALRTCFAVWRDIEWSLKAKRAIKKNASSYDVVISSYPNASTHDAALFAKRIGKAKVWIADFRDPMVLESFEADKHTRLVRKQTQIVKNADMVTHVSKNGSEHFVCRVEDRHKVLWLPNGFDNDDFTAISSETSDHTDNCVVFSHAGGLYHGERDCSPLFRAIWELINAHEITSEDVRFDYAGPDYGILRKQADKYGLAAITRNLGIIPRPEALRMQNESDCVVVATFCYSDNGGAMTGKVYEPVLMRRPILMLVNGSGKNSEPGEFVKYLQAGTVYEAANDGDDVTNIKKMILALKDEKAKYHHTTSRMNEEKREDYNYNRLVDTLIDYVNQATRTL